MGRAQLNVRQVQPRTCCTAGGATEVNSVTASVGRQAGHDEII